MTPMTIALNQNKQNNRFIVMTIKRHSKHRVSNSQQMSTTSIFNEKPRHFVLIQSLHNEAILNEAFLTVGSDRSWPRGLTLNP